MLNGAEKYKVYEVEVETHEDGSKQNHRTYIGETIAKSTIQAIKNVKYNKGIKRPNVWYDNIGETEIKHCYIAEIV